MKHRITFLFLTIAGLTAHADSLEQIANVFVEDGLKLRHLEFSITDTGLESDGDKKHEIRTDRFGDTPQQPDGRILLQPGGNAVSQAYSWDYNASRPGKYWV